MGLENILIGKKVDEAVQKERYARCESCPFFQQTTKSCGTLFMGGTGQFSKNGQNLPKFRLCGCYLPKKTQYILEKCPGGKW